MSHLFRTGMKTLTHTHWAAPLVTTAFAVAAFASVFAELFPAPYYLSLSLPLVVAANIVVVFYQTAVLPQLVFRTMLSSILPLSLVYLWFTQTA